MLMRLLREPLVHFLGAAVAVFAVYGFVTGPAEQPRDRITVSAARIEQMGALFAQTRMRPPAPEELMALIDDHVAEELFVREAMLLGLDQDDTVVRRRLRQKMEFLIAAEAEAQSPTDADLQAYLTAHPEAFRIGAQFAFEQVYLSPQTRGDQVASDAAALLVTFRADPDTDPASFGDPTLLPPTFPLSDQAQIASVFGPEFAADLTSAAPGDWFGPLNSDYGQHVVRVTAQAPARLPPLDEIRDTVAREWMHDRTGRALATHLGQLLDRHDVIVDMPQTAPAP